MLSRCLFRWLPSAHGDVVVPMGQLERLGLPAKLAPMASMVGTAKTAATVWMVKMASMDEMVKMASMDEMAATGVLVLTEEWAPLDAMVWMASTVWMASMV